MAIITLTEAMAVPDIMSTDLFRLELGAIPGVTTNNLNILCQNFTVSEESNAMYQQKIGTHVRGFRGQREDGHQLSVRFSNAVDNSTANALRTWDQQIAGQESGTSSGYIKDYSITAGATVYDTTGKAVETWTLRNFFLINVQEIDFEYGESQPYIVGASFWFDYKRSSAITYR